MAARWRASRFPRTWLRRARSTSPKALARSSRSTDRRWWRRSSARDPASRPEPDEEDADRQPSADRGEHPGVDIRPHPGAPAWGRRRFLRPVLVRLDAVRVADRPGSDRTRDLPAAHLAHVRARWVAARDREHGLSLDLRR